MKYSAMLFLRSLWFMSTVFFCRPAPSLTADLILLILRLNSFWNISTVIWPKISRLTDSLRSFFSKFKNEAGYTIHNYITSKRLLLARSLINEGSPVIKAAQMSGFNDYTTFVRSYKKQFGNAPSHVWFCRCISNDLPVYILEVCPCPVYNKRYSKNMNIHGEKLW